MSFRDTLTNYIRAGYNGIGVQTTEEKRVLKDILAIAKSLKNRQVLVWSSTDGLQIVAPTQKEIQDTFDLGGTLTTILKGIRAYIEWVDAVEEARRAGRAAPRAPSGKLVINDAVVILRDIHTWPFDRDPTLARGLRDVLMDSPAAGVTIVITAPEYRPHPTFERLVTVMDYTLPSPEDFASLCDDTAKSYIEGGSKSQMLKATPEVIRALGGLSFSEAENALALSCIVTGGYDPITIYAEKVAAVRRSGLLELIEPDPRGLDAVGGLDLFKAWLRKRIPTFSPAAREYKLPKSKGILFCGVPGTGKSLLAKSIGTALGIPTLKLDIGSLFNSLVGESETRARDALKLAEAVAPVVLWLNRI